MNNTATLSTTNNSPCPTVRKQIGKYDLTQHPNYKYTSDFDKKNEFNIEQFLSRRLKLKAGDEFVVVDAD